MDIDLYLQKLGLSIYQIKAYKALVELKLARAGAISAKSKVPQSKIYGVLDSLAEKGLINIMPSKPKEYTAIEPHIVIENLISSKKDAISVLESEKELVLKAMNLGIEPKDEFAIEVFFGRDQHIKIGLDILRSSKKECMMLLRSLRSRGLIDILSINKKIKMKVMIQMLNEENVDIIEKVIKAGIPIKISNARRFKIILADNDLSYICIPNPKDFSSYFTVKFNGQEFNKAMRELYSGLWAKAKLVTMKDIQQVKAKH